MQPIRTFIACEISPQVLYSASRIIERLKASEAKIKWIRTENLHFTLKFLGDVAAERIVDVCRSVEDAVGSLSPFELAVHGCGAFPNVSKPRTIWLGTTDGSQAMQQLAGQIESALEPMGFVPEARRYTPHLTLGRVRENPAPVQARLSEILQRHAEFDAGATIVDEVVVFSSSLGRGGPKYEALSRIELRG